jgi:hypothetical protein
MQKLVDYFVVVGYESPPPPLALRGLHSPHHNHLHHPNNNNIDDDYLNQYSSRRSGGGGGGGILGPPGRAKIVQRFPAEDSCGGGGGEFEDETTFDANIHAFCQPHKGWRLYGRQEAPTYFVSVLTDIKGERRLAACLTFLEPFSETAAAAGALRSNENGASNNVDSASSDFSDSDDLPVVRVIIMGGVQYTQFFGVN